MDGTLFQTFFLHLLNLLIVHYHALLHKTEKFKNFISVVFVVHDNNFYWTELTCQNVLFTKSSWNVSLRGTQSFQNGGQGEVHI